MCESKTWSVRSSYLTSVDEFRHLCCLRKSRITMAVQPSQARSLYRRFLRELPSRTPSILANPSPMQKHIRDDFMSPEQSQSKSQRQRLHEAEQHVQYLKAQRMYITLVERYNPGANMNEEERVRLTARRVGMDLPIEMQQGGSENGGGSEGR